MVDYSAMDVSVLVQVFSPVGLGLIGLILARSILEHLFTRYVIYYMYLTYVLVQSAGLMILYKLNSGLYARAYWYAEFIGVILGCGVIWEIYSQTLKPYAGVERFARYLLLAAILLAVGRVVTRHWGAPASLFSRQPTADLDQTMREIQAIFLLLILGLLVYYSIPLGKNLKGMIAGYVLYIGATIVELACRVYLGKVLQIQPVAYLAALIIWCAALWSYAPNPLPEEGSELESDYQAVSAMTHRALSQARRYLSRGAWT